MVATLDAVSDKPDALGAVAQAMSERPQIAAMIMVQREDAIRSTIRALLQEVEKNAPARRAFLIAVQENSVAMANLIAQDSKVLASMLRAFGKVGLSHGKTELEALIKAIDPDGKD
jgi:hypothetical protein